MEVKLCAPCGAKNAAPFFSFFLSIMLFAMLSFIHRFWCVFLNMFMFNSVKQC